MLIFLLALQSPRASCDWQLVSGLCERTWRSLCQQTLDRFRVILVGNERPACQFTHPGITVTAKDFQLPQDKRGRMLDTWIQVRSGLVAAREFPATMADPLENYFVLRHGHGVRQSGERRP